MKLIRGFHESSSESFDTEDLVELYHHSVRNKLPLLFLSTLKTTNRLRNLKNYWEKENRKYLQATNAIKRISELFLKRNIEHAFFKTIRPYISATVDIDVLVFGEEKYLEAAKTLRNTGYLERVYGPASATFQDPVTEIAIDLYKQVAVSYIPYIDSDKLADYVTDMELLEGKQIKILTPEADLLTIIAHSLIKENMYTLSEYYTYICYLEKLDLNQFIGLARKTHLESSIRTHTTITSELCKAAHKNIPEKINLILQQIGSDAFETSMLQEYDYDMPHKYHPFTTFRCLLEITKERTTRKGIANQILHAFDPRFSADFLKKLVNHIVRETY